MDQLLDQLPIYSILSVVKLFLLLQDLVVHPLEAHLREALQPQPRDQVLQQVSNHLLRGCSQLH